MLQTVFFVRHAEGWHNVGFESNQDSHLTPYGWEQGAALRKHIMALQPPLNLQVRRLHNLLCCHTSCSTQH